MQCMLAHYGWSLVRQGKHLHTSVEENEDQTGNTSKDVIAELGRVSDTDSRAVEMRGDCS